MAIDLREQVQIDYLEDALLQQHRIRMGMLRLDLVHPLVSGNKWFKLKENIRAARVAGKDTLLSFGGAYSNHLHAMAAAAQAFQLKSTGIIRGFHGKDLPSETLQQCREMGMELVYVSREEYSKKADPSYLSGLQEQYPDAWLIPEGGNNEAGFSGAGTIAAYIPADATMVALPIGTGTTFCGIRQQLDKGIAMLGFPVMKGGDYLYAELSAQIDPGQDNWMLETAMHFGGFAKHTPELLHFMNRFYAIHRIPLDFVYTGKMIYGVEQMIRDGRIADGSHIICIHTGGLQGNRSVQAQLSYTGHNH